MGQMPLAIPSPISTISDTERLRPTLTSLRTPGTESELSQAIIQDGEPTVQHRLFTPMLFQSARS
jgi:hypothetical protein